MSRPAISAISTRAARADRIDARHIMASGALPPGLPPVEIDGAWWWDGGLVSNTPLQPRARPSAGGSARLPGRSVSGARRCGRRRSWTSTAREKDIRYSSRTRQVTDQLIRLRKEREAIREVLDKLPPDMRGRSRRRPRSPRSPPSMRSTSSTSSTASMAGKAARAISNFRARRWSITGPKGSPRSPRRCATTPCSPATSSTARPRRSICAACDHSHQHEKIRKPPCSSTARPRSSPAPPPASASLIAKALAGEGAKVMINGFGDAAAIEKERAGAGAASGARRL